jgi:ElaB/YqjD/DUF883 family membrane-anchored ribosome-binding protein
VGQQFGGLVCQEIAMNEAPTSQVVELFAGIDDLIRRVADSENPEIRKIRAKVYAALVAARSSFDVSANRVRRQAFRVTPQITDGIDEYLEEDPAPALGIALLVGLGVGLVVSLRQ